jgi:hypothetical protein
MLLSILLGSCSPRIAEPEEPLAATSTIAPTASNTPSASPTVIPSATPTADPNLPCGGVMPERVYLFLDCSDVRRIRENLAAGNSELRKIWNIDKQVVDGYRMPQTHDPSRDYDQALWWGPGNYIAQDTALIYLVTGDRRYADRIRSLLDLVRAGSHSRWSLGNYTEEQAGGLLSNPRYGPMPFISLAFAYLSIRDTEYFTEQERQEFDDFFMQQGFLSFEVLRRRGGQITLDSWINRNVPHGSAIVAATMAAAFPDHSRAKELHDKVQPVLEWQITNWWHLDGGWGEDTESYGFNRLEPLLLLAETLKKNGGIDLYQVDYGGKTLGALCRHYVNILTPEGMSPAMNDTAHYYMDPGILRLCAYRINDPQLSFAADSYRWGWEHAYNRSQLGDMTMLGEIAWWGLAPKPREPDFTSVASSSTGYAILRSDWSYTASYALLQFTSSKVHQDQSFGALYLYDGGPWIVGNGYHESAHRTTANSTLSFGGYDQTATGGALLDFADLSQIGLMRVEGHTYPDSTHTRTLAWIKTWHQWLVWDDAMVFDKRTRDLQLNWFVRGKFGSNKDNVWYFSRAAGSPLVLSVAMYPPEGAEYKKIERHFDWEEWIGDAVGVEMDVPVKNPSIRLVTAITSAKDVPVVSRADEAGGTILTSTLNDETWQWAIPFQKGKVQIGEQTVDGSAGCHHRKNNVLQGYCLYGGSSLAVGADGLVLSSAPIDVEADVAASQVVVVVASRTDISFFWPDAVNTIQNGTTPILFEQQAHTISLSLAPGKYILRLQ